MCGLHCKHHAKFNLLILCFCVSTILVCCAQSTQGSLKVIYAINAGGNEHTDQNGIHYESDPLHNKIGTASDYGNQLLIIGRVPQQDEVLYRTERYHTASFGYALPIDGDGEYALIMKFCEVYFNEPNKKIFDVRLNKQHTIVQELDIFHQVGRGTAHEEYAFFTVKDGRLYYKEEESQIRNGFVRLDFIKGNYDNPKINAFALLKGDVDRIPRLSPTSDDHLPMDADMAVFHDRISGSQPVPNEIPSIDSSKEEDDFDDSDETDAETDEYIENEPIIDSPMKVRKTSGPRQPNPYHTDEQSALMPVLIAIGAFIPLLFCLCKL